MPSLTPVTEASETLTPVGEVEFVAALPSLYPSANTYPSVAGTYPSNGTPSSGMSLTPLTEA